ncbi:hypothetical protein BB560_007109 [Smittium megazygosporum]|uniref:LEM-like domain-containing protein n=1 Tax=Smittium megazygosporum TaxID=133381 RepID=A0A2T9XYT9_9FUNG|nr:hypothetical protein BB560_007109 [Smittium megazygosporum]
MDDQYPGENFDPQLLKVPQLRSILVKYGINYPASAKKDELVSIINEKVNPMVHDTRASSSFANLSTVSPYKKVKPKKNKKKANKSTAPTTELDKTETELSPTLPEPKATRKKRSAKSAKLSIVEPPATKIKNNQDSISENENLEPNSVPVHQPEEIKSPVKRKSVFSDENPFQSAPTSASKKLKSIPAGSSPTEKKVKIKPKRNSIGTASPQQNHSGQIQSPESLGGLKNTLQLPKLSSLPSKKVDSGSTATTPTTSSAKSPSKSARSPKKTSKASENKKASPTSATKASKKDTEFPPFIPSGKVSTNKSSLVQPLDVLDTPIAKSTRSSSMAYNNSPSKKPTLANESSTIITRSRRNTEVSINIPTNLVREIHSSFTTEKKQPRPESSDSSTASSKTTATISNVFSEILQNQVTPSRSASIRDTSLTKTPSPLKRHSTTSTPREIAMEKALVSPERRSSNAAQTSTDMLLESVSTKLPARKFFSSLVIFAVFTSSLYLGYNRQAFLFDHGFSGERFVQESARPWIPEYNESNVQILPKLKFYSDYITSSLLKPHQLTCPEHAVCQPNVPLPRFIDPTNPNDSIVSSALDSGGYKIGQIIQCDPGYIIKYPLKPLKLSFPFPPKCVKGPDVNSRIDTMADRIKHALQSHRGKVECTLRVQSMWKHIVGKFNNRTLFEPFKTPSAQEWDIISKIKEADFDDPDQIVLYGKQLEFLESSLRSIPFSTNAEYELLFINAINNLLDDPKSGIQLIDLASDSTQPDGVDGNNDEKDEISSDIPPKNELWLVADKPNYSILCKFRLALLFVFSSYLFSTSVVGIALFVLYTMYKRLKNNSEETHGVQELTDTVSKMLELVARFHCLDPVFAPYPNVLANELFDLILFGDISEDPAFTARTKPGSYNLKFFHFLVESDTNPSEFIFPTVQYYDPRVRQRSWDKVVEFVKESENIKVGYHKIGASDKVVESWEWIGPMNLE